MEELPAVRPVYQPKQVTDEVIGDYLSNLGNKLTAYHRKQFINICKQFNLSPFAREIYGIPYGDNFNIIVGYEVYLKRAETSGQLAGWRAWTEGEGQNIKGCVEISRKDWEKPFYHEVYLEEYDQKNSMWKSKPRTMIKKVAIAQGFRMAFPVELGGIPYTADELPSIEPVSEQRQVSRSTKPVASVPQEKTATQGTGTVRMASEAQIKMIRAKLGKSGINEESFKAHYKLDHMAELLFSDVNTALKLIDSGEIAEVAAEPAKEAPLPEICNNCGNVGCNGECMSNDDDDIPY